ncbi:MAG: sulfatase, partial [Verrucomicrobiales bacterium]|nr:sulfatase [Verrucomicrobiales bacterium]
PNIDALAESGIRFDRFYTCAGVCSAMRSGTVVGMMQTTIGAHNHRSCRAAFRGKSMGEYDKNVLPEGVKTVPEIFRESGYYTFNNGKDDYNFEWDGKKMYDWLGKGLNFKGAEKGTEWSGCPDGKPWFGQIQLSGGKTGKKAKKGVDRAKVPVPPYYPDVPEVREEIAHHYDCLLFTDDQVGQIMAALKRDGLLENTYVILLSDHGYKLHRHKQMLYEGGIHMPLIVSGPKISGNAVRDDLVSSIDIAPASLGLAGVPIPDKMEGRNFMAHGYKKRDYVISARDRCDYTIEKIRAVVTPKFKYLRNYTDDRPFMQPTYKDPWPVSQKLRELMAAGEMNETQLIFFDPDGKEPEELYNLEDDPHEINNLAKDPKYAGELERHRQILADWIAETGDKGQAPESDIGLLCTLKRWGDKCVNPEYDRVRHLLKKKE